MNQTDASIPLSFSNNDIKATTKKSTLFLRAFLSGLLLPLGFAPFHIPGLAILSLAFLFMQLINQSPKKAAAIAFTFGLGFLGLGTSWVYNSIHIYGELDFISSALFTLLFVAAFSLYPAIFGFLFAKLKPELPLYATPFLFSSLWFFSEYFRATSFTGFPWLLVGFGQMDSPLQHLLPFIGVLGVGAVTALLSALLGLALLPNQKQKRVLLCLFVLGLLTPLALKNKANITVHHEPISVGLVQADIAMRDKWDPAFYSNIQNHYQTEIEKLLPNKNLIVLPESAIPMPSHYAHDFLDTIHQKALEHKSAVLLGIPHPDDETNASSIRYHNALLALGEARGAYLKQHLVPFGEYVPKSFLKLTDAIHLPDPNMATGTSHQKPVAFQQYNIAALICYELGYPDLIRAQLPKAAFIVSLSDDGWFGHSLAMYQHVQMAQALSKQTGRYQILANNNGCSSLIDSSGHIINQLPAFKKDTLEGTIYPATGATPWVQSGGAWLLYSHALFILFIIGYRLILAAKAKREYSNQPSSLY